MGEKFGEATDFYAWKGYNFDILNELNDADYIRQGNHPSRSKSVYITESGMEQARKLLAKYGIEDWKRKWEYVAVDGEKVLIASENLLIEAVIDSLNANKNTKENAKNYLPTWASMVYLDVMI